MKYDVITIGSAVRDTFLFLSPSDAPVIVNPARDPRRRKLVALEHGAKIDVTRSARTVGGGGANAAVSFARLGLRTAAVVRVGQDADGDCVVDVFRREGVAGSFVRRDAVLPTAFSVLLVAGEKEQDRVALTERGASGANNFSPSAPSIASAAWYYTSALAGKGWKKELADIVSVVRTRGIRWAWNPGSLQLKAGLAALKPFMKACSVFNVNRDEALELVGGGDVKTLLRALRSAGPERVVVSDGLAGAYYADGDTMLKMTADSSIRAMEPTGAGDAFGSGFVAGLFARNDVAYALDAGITNAESVICKVGAQDALLSARELARAIKKRSHKLSYV